MKYANERENLPSVVRRSNRSTISPYLVEDVAMTRGELEKARVVDTMIIVAR